jgi:pyrroline-5-carboxylate reductase
MSLRDHRIGFIGAGNMAEAIVRGLLSAETIPADSIFVSDVRKERLGAFSTLGVIALSDNKRVADEVDILILSVKPQVMADVLTELKPLIDPETLVISIAAGVRTSTIESRLQRDARIVRVMPNTPLLVGKGISALVTGKKASRDDLELVSEIFSSSGEVLLLKDESMMDAVTAVSGSGPAYVFYLAEAMLKAAKAEGLPDDIAEKLVRFTIRGAGEMLTAAGAPSPSDLRRQVTSPNGTTEAAVKIMDSAAVLDTLVRAVRRAAERSRELGKGS